MEIASRRTPVSLTPTFRMVRKVSANRLTTLDTLRRSFRDGVSAETSQPHRRRRCYSIERNASDNHPRSAVRKFLPKTIGAAGAFRGCVFYATTFMVKQIR